MLQDIESDVAVDHIDQTALVRRDAVALRRRPACRGLRDEVADLTRVNKPENDDPSIVEPIELTPDAA
jgi:hypothetical protein